MVTIVVLNIAVLTIVVLNIAVLTIVVDMVVCVCAYGRVLGTSLRDVA